MEMRGGLTHRYRTFAEEAADSPCFADWARGVAEDPELHAWLSDLTALDQQPNLVFAAARWHGAVAPGEYHDLKRTLFDRETQVKETIRSRSTQTNEVGRLATLTPLLARLGGPENPLALVEVGASAGLCLFPDRYDYEWPPLGALTGSGGPRLTARVEGAMPVPMRHPAVAWRAGCDLNPLDVRDQDQMAWLEMLVWPEQDERRQRLRAAIEVAAARPPLILGGDLVELLPGLVDEAGRHGEPVVFHSAVVAYLDDAARERFTELMTQLVAERRCRWISNEGRQVLPGVTATGPPMTEGLHWFVLGLDGRAVAWTHGHGAAMRWLS